MNKSYKYCGFTFLIILLGNFVNAQSINKRTTKKPC